MISLSKQNDMKLKILLTILTILFFVVGAIAQKKVITGTVTNESGEPIEGATVGIKGSGVFVLTNKDGYFQISLPEEAKAIVVSHIGMENVELPIDERSEFNFILKPKATSLSRVVVVGYGAVKKSDLTGAIQTIDRSELNMEVPTNVLEAIQGKMAGVVVTQNDGSPGSGISIRIRGSNSFLGGTAPLYVIDGVPLNVSSSTVTPGSLGEDEKQTLNALSFLNPNDIESITVLKDASAAAIYGSRGANGVVLITTRQGRKGEDRLELNANLGFAQISRRLNPLNAFYYATYQNMAYSNANKHGGTSYELPYPGEDRPDPLNPGESYYAKGPEDFRDGGIDWQDKVFRTGLYQNYSISLSGGTDIGNHYLSFNYLDQEGTIINSAYNRYNLNFNLNRKVGRIFKVGTRNSISFTHTDGVKTGTDKADAASAGVIRSVLTYPTTRTTILPYGEASGNEKFITNPLLYAGDVLNRVKTLNIFSSNFIEAAITPDLKLRQNIGFNYYTSLRDQYYPRTVYEGFSTKGKGLKADNLWQSIVSETMLTYDKELNKHHLTVVAGGTYEQTNSERKRMEAQTFPNDLLKNENLEAGEQIMPLKNNKTQSTLISFLGRVNYAFEDKYLVTASYRRDGSSKFGEYNKWAGFASAALAWKISSEQFMQEQNLFSNLKLRVSFGQTGNQGIGPYSSLSKLTVYNYPFGGSLSTGLADDYWAGPANPNLKWETTTSYNLGLDAAFFENRLRLTVDVYTKKTNDLLQFVTTPSSTGFSRQLRNAGSVRNKGLEIVLEGTPIVRDNFTWSSNFNIAINRNKILSIGPDIKEQFADNISTRYAPFIQIPGHSIGTLYGYVEDGYYDNEAEVRNDPQFTNESKEIILRMIGEVKYKNLDDDPSSISISDRRFIGDVNPDYTLGFVNNFRYKNLDMSILIYSVQGNDVVNMNKRYNANLGGFKNITKEMYEGAWSRGGDNADATGPKIMRQYWRSFKFSRRFIEDGSYVRLKNITVGYTFSSLIKGISSMRVSAGVNNLLTITNYSGYDPEINSYGDNAALFGVDLGGYPNSRTINFTLRCNF